MIKAWKQTPAASRGEKANCGATTTCSESGGVEVTWFTRSARRFFGLVAIVSMSGCGADSFTPDACDSVPRYDIRDEGVIGDGGVVLRPPERSRFADEIRAAAEKGCITEPHRAPPLSQ